MGGGFHSIHTSQNVIYSHQPFFNGMDNGIVLDIDNIFTFWERSYLDLRRLPCWLRNAMGLQRCHQHHNFKEVQKANWSIQGHLVTTFLQEPLWGHLDSILGDSIPSADHTSCSFWRGYWVAQLIPIWRLFQVSHSTQDFLSGIPPSKSKLGELIRLCLWFFENLLNNYEQSSSRELQVFCGCCRLILGLLGHKK